MCAADVSSQIRYSVQKTRSHPASSPVLPHHNPEQDVSAECIWSPTAGQTTTPSPRRINRYNVPVDPTPRSAHDAYTSHFAATAGNLERVKELNDYVIPDKTEFNKTL